MKYDDVITCTGKNGVLRYFYVTSQKEAGGKTHFNVSRHPGTSRRHPEYDGNDFFQASFVRHDEGTLRLSEMFAHAPYYRGKGIPRAVLSFATRQTDKKIVSSQKSGPGAERQSDDATKMWKRLQASGCATYLRSEERYKFIDPDDCTYVLDTSALKGLGRKEIEKAAQHARVCVSPLSILEMLCHLDEPWDPPEDDPQTTYLRRRGNLLKCRSLCLLPAPIADFTTRIGHPDKINETWHQAAELCASLLEKLAHHDNPSDFYASTIIDSDGSSRPVKDVVPQCSAVLEEAESDYVDHMEDWVTSLDANCPGWSEFEADDFIEVVADECRAMCDEFGLEESEDLVRCGASLYPYFGYMFSRAQKCDASIDANDTEDGLLCLHLGLDMPRTFVTSDPGSANALQNSIEQYQATGDGGLARFRAISPDTFRQKTEKPEFTGLQDE
jgi:hypothetical protein